MGPPLQNTMLVLLLYCLSAVSANILTNALFGIGSTAANATNATIAAGADSTGLNATGLNSTEMNGTVGMDRLEDLLRSGKVHIMIQRILLIPVDSTGQDLGNEMDGETEKIPDVEFDKLKKSAMQAGLSEEKSERLVRAVQMSNASYSEVSGLRTVLSNATTSANFADHARVMLEENLKDQVAKDAATSPHQEIHLPVSQSTERPDSIVAVEGPGHEEQEASNATIDPALIRRLQVSAQLAGLNQEQIRHFMLSVRRANLNATQIAELDKAITSHAPTADDLVAVGKILGWQTNDLAGALRSGLFNSTGPITEHHINRTARAAGPLYGFDRACGFTGIESSRWSNGKLASPLQYPWAVAIMNSRREFLGFGTLVSDNLVLTAASVILSPRTNNEALTLVLGAWDLPPGSDPNNWLPKLEVSSRNAVVHSQYRNDAGTDSRYNIGLVRLAEAVNFNRYPHIFPLCLINKEMEGQIQAAQTGCTIVGWPDETNSGRRSQVMAFGSVTPSQSNCPSATGSCSSGETCMCNAGSPVMCPGSTPGRYYLHSIAVARPNCRSTTSASVNTVDVVEHYDFLQRYVAVVPPA